MKYHLGNEEYYTIEGEFEIIDQWSIKTGILEWAEFMIVKQNQQLYLFGCNNHPRDAIWRGQKISQRELSEIENNKENSDFLWSLIYC